MGRKKKGQPKKWLGGYVRHGKRGPTYVIERWVDGRRYHVSTKCRTQRAALKQLEDFEVEPQSYKPERASRERVGRRRGAAITPELVLEYVKWMQNRPRRPTTKEHASAHGHRLADWIDDLRGRDMRFVTLRELKEALAGKKSLGMRIQAIKAFCSWLRTEKFLLERSEDPTLDIHQPEARAAKDVRKVAVEPERIRAILPLLPEITRDVMILRLGTGWHIAEAMRFARSGTIRKTPGKFIYLMTADGPVRTPLLATVHTKQLKARIDTNTPILYEEHLAAAERLLARGRVYSYYTLNRHVTDACRRAGVERFINGHIRHSVVTYASEAGADLEHASVFVDHLSVDTTRKHYRQMALPKKAVPVLRLVDGGRNGNDAAL